MYKNQLHNVKFLRGDNQSFYTRRGFRYLYSYEEEIQLSSGRTSSVVDNLIAWDLIR